LNHTAFSSYNSKNPYVLPSCRNESRRLVYILLNKVKKNKDFDNEQVILSMNVVSDHMAFLVPWKTMNEFTVVSEHIISL